MTAKKPTQQSENKNDQKAEPIKRYCGIVMPISAMPPEYDSGHWSRVYSIISDAITDAKLVPRMVSDSDEVGVIHGQIVQHLYDDEIVVVDVSGKNPNVMFELGIRLAFDKPTIIVKDETTSYSFDTSPIKHIEYRKDQRYDDVDSFKKKVTNSIISTLEKKKEDVGFSPFLRHFGQFTPKIVESHEIPQAEFILRKLSEIENLIGRISPHSEQNEVPSVIRFKNSGNNYGFFVGRDRYLTNTRSIIRYFFDKEKPSSRDDIDVLKEEMKNEVTNLVLPSTIPIEIRDSIFLSSWELESSEYIRRNGIDI